MALDEIDMLRLQLASAEGALNHLHAPGTLSAYWKNRALYAEDMLKRTADKLAEVENELIVMKAFGSRLYD